MNMSNSSQFRHNKVWLNIVFNHMSTKYHPKAQKVASPTSSHKEINHCHHHRRHPHHHLPLLASSSPRFVSLQCRATLWPCRPSHCGTSSWSCSLQQGAWPRTCSRRLWNESLQWLPCVAPPQGVVATFLASIELSCRLRSSLLQLSWPPSSHWISPWALSSLSN